MTEHQKSLLLERAITYSEVPVGKPFRFIEAPKRLWEKTPLGVAVDESWKMLIPRSDVLCVLEECK